VAVSPLTIAALTSGTAAHDVARQLARLGAVEQHDSAPALVARVAAGGVHVVVTELEDAAGRPVAPALLALAAREPALPVIVYARVNLTTFRPLLAVLTPGLRMECVVRPHEPLAPAVQRVRSPSFVPGIAPLLLQRFAVRAPPPLRAFVAVAALVASRRRCLEQVARWSGLTARTVERRLRRERWPSPRTVLQSFAALDAVWLMTEHDFTAREVARVRALPHPSTVTRLLERYCGCRPATLPESGGLAAALTQVGRLLAPRGRR
jgi:DNA-binding phage protein